MITGKILKTYGWPEGKIIGLAKAAAEDLAKTGLEQGAILVWLDGVREDPGKYSGRSDVRHAGARVSSPRQSAA